MDDHVQEDFVSRDLILQILNRSIHLCYLRADFDIAKTVEWPRYVWILQSLVYLVNLVGIV